MRPSWLSALRIAFSGLLLASSAASSSAEHNWRNEQKIWWTTPSLVKNAVVNFLGLRTASNTDLPGKKPESIVELLLLLDKKADPETVNVLADLSTYDPGTYGSEIYTCLIVRKGTIMISAIESRDSDKTDDCARTLGSSHPSCIASRGPKARHERIADLVARVKDNQPCGIEY
jgi:hypothetical protein